MCLICEGRIFEVKEELDCGDCSNVTEIPVIPGLKKLWCSDCISLKKIPDIPGLEKLWCVNCPLLPKNSVTQTILVVE